MEHVNVYDWDKTIFPVDSTAAFCLWCARRYPRVGLHFAGVAPSAAAFLSGKLEKTRFKERLYGFLRYIPDIDAEVRAFWDVNFPRINAWYLAQARPDDIVISASPEFLVGEATDRLGIRLLASRVDKRTGATTGENCWGPEKVERLRAAYPDVTIAAFYSDSHSDDPLAALADEAYLVKGSELLPW